MNKLGFALGCLLAGGSGCAFVLLNIDHKARFSGGQTMLLVVMFGSLVVGMAGFVAFLSWRDDRRPATMVSRPAPVQPPAPVDPKEALKEGVYGLRPGVTYQVIKPFVDHYNTAFAAGEHLTFIQRHFLPYHEGHTLVFAPRPIYLQGGMNADVLGHLADYITVARELPHPQVLQQMRYSPTEWIYLEITGTGIVQSFLNDPLSSSAERWTLGEVLAGNADKAIQRDFGAEALAELKAAVRARSKSG